MPARGRHRLRRAFVWAIAAVGLLFVSLYVPSVQTALFARATAWIESRFGIVVRAAHVVVDPLALRITADRVSVSNRQTPETSFFTAERVEIDAASAVLSGHPVLERVHVVSPHVDTRAIGGQGGGGRGSVGSSDSAWGGLGPLVLGDVVVENLSLTAGTPDAAEMTLTGLSLQARGGAPGRLDVRAVIPGTLLLVISDTRIPFEAVSGSFGLDGDRLTIAGVTGRLAAGQVDVTGQLRLAAPDPLQLDYSAALDLRRIASWWDLPAAVGGRAAIAGRVTGPFRSPTATIRAEATGFEWSALKQGRLTANGSVTAAGVRLDAFDLVAPMAVARGRGHLSWRDEDPPSRVTADWRAPRLRVLAPLADLDPADVPRVAASGTVELAWPGFVPGLQNLGGSIRAAVTSGHADNDDRGDFELTGSRARWRVNWRQVLPGTTVAQADASIRLDPGLFGRSAVSGTLSIRSDDVPAAMRRLVEMDVIEPDSSLLTLEAGRFEGTGLIEGTARAPRWRATILADAMALAGLAGISATGTFAVDRFQIEFESMALTAPGSRVEARGVVRFDTVPGQGSFTGVVDPAWAGAPFVPAEWAVSGPVSVTAEWPDPAGEGELAVDFDGLAVKVGGRPAGPVTAHVVLTGETFTGLLEAPELGSRLTGTYDLTEARPPQIHVDLDRADLARLLAAGGVASGTVTDIHVRATGSVDATGAFSDPDRLHVAADLRDLSGDVRGRPVKLEAPATVRWTDGAIDVSLPDLAVGDARVSVTPSSGGQSARVVVVKATAPLAELLALLPPGVAPAGLAADGTLTVEGEVPAGRPQELVVRAVLEAVSVTQDGTAVAQNLHAEARLARGLLDVPSFGATVRGAAVSGSASVPAAWLGSWLASLDGSPGDGRVQARVDASLVPVLTALGIELPELSGSARVRVDLTSDEPTLDRVRGTIVADTLEVTTNAATFALDGPGSLRVGDGLLTIDRLKIRGQNSSLQATGHVGLTSDADVAVRVQGSLSMSLVDALVAPRVDGSANIDVRVAGTVGRPSFDGEIAFRDISAVSPTARLVLADWAGRVLLRPGIVEALDVGGQVNGGTVTLSGAFPLSGARDAAPLRVEARDVFLEYPPGLRNRISAALNVTGGVDAPRIGGSVTLLAEPYREGVTKMAQLVAALGQPAQPAARAESSRLGRTVLDLSLTALGPLRLDNSLGQVDLVPELRIVGTVDRPALAGSIDIVDGGRVRLQSRTYELTESRMDFTPADGMVPRLFVRGVTRVGDYMVTLRLGGPADAVQANLSSDPPLNERDLQGLLVTGQTSEGSIREAGSEKFAVAALSSDLLGIAGQSLGLDSVRIGNESFELVSSDVDPATRLTVSKSFGGRFELVYSDNLDDNTATWIVVYRPRRYLEFRASSRDNIEQVVELRHQIAFGPGGTRAAATRPRSVSAGDLRETVASVRVTGDEPAATAQLTQMLKLRSGSLFEYGQWMADVGRLRQFYFDAGHLTARVVPIRTRLDPDGTPKARVGLEYRVTPGPATRVVVEGVPADDELLARLRRAWFSTAFDQFVADDLSKAARAVLVARGHVAPAVETYVTAASEEGMVATVTVVPGPRPDTRTIEPSGMSALSRSELDSFISGAGAGIGPWIDPAPLCGAIADFYASRGFLSARVSSGPVRVSGANAVLPILVDEGPRTVVGRVEIDGVDPARREGARQAVALETGSAFSAGADRAARLALERYYQNLGFRDAAVSVRRTEPDASGRTDIAFTATEGPQQVVRSLEVEGASSTRRSVIDRAITLRPGAPAGQLALDTTQRQLYQLGTFTSADVRLEPAKGGGTATTGVVPVDAVVSVVEPKRYQLVYGIELSNEYGPVFDDFVNAAGFAADVRDRNVLGRGLTASVGGRYERNLQAVRSLFAVPPLGALARLGIRTNFYAGWRVESEDVEPDFFAEEETLSASVEQRWRPRPWLDVSWGYIYDDQRFTLTSPRGLAPVVFEGVLASLNGAVIFDRRDSVFDSTRGWFHSSSFQQGLQALGSDFSYSRYLARTFGYVRLGPLVSATGVRFGSIFNTDGPPPLSVADLLFKAGGSQTVRGYAQDQLSAAFVQDIPIGGTRLLILNQELRFPMTKWFKGVVFADAGNAFDLSGFDLSDLAVGLGFGVRIMTPVAPIRIDLGFPVPRRAGDPLYRWHISIGQMF